MSKRYTGCLLCGNKRYRREAFCADCLDEYGEERCFDEMHTWRGVREAAVAIEEGCDPCACGQPERVALAEEWGEAFTPYEGWCEECGCPSTWELASA